MTIAKEISLENLKILFMTSLKLSSTWYCKELSQTRSIQKRSDQTSKDRSNQSCMLSNQAKRNVNLLYKMKRGPPKTHIPRRFRSVDRSCSFPIHDSAAHPFPAMQTWVQIRYNRSLISHPHPAFPTRQTPTKHLNVLIFS